MSSHSTEEKWFGCPYCNRKKLFRGTLADDKSTVQIKCRGCKKVISFKGTKKK